MDWLEVFGLLTAAALGGAVNAVAGGGSLISFPAPIPAVSHRAPRRPKRSRSFRGVRHSSRDF